MAMRFAGVFVLVAALDAGCGSNSAPTDSPPSPRLSPDAPRGRPVDAKGKAEAEAYRAAIAPYVAMGRKTYPEAKKRYLAGLPAGHTFFAVTSIGDDRIAVPPRPSEVFRRRKAEGAA